MPQNLILFYTPPDFWHNIHTVLKKYFMGTRKSGKEEDKKKLLEEESNRKRKIKEAEKELEKLPQTQMPGKKIDEQDSDGSANAFENK